MNRSPFVITGIALIIGLTGCSRKKDKFINRNWHAVTTEYNTLYNGNLALDLGTRQIADTYFENFWEILPVERMQVSDEIVIEGTNSNENFQVAEEKATKAIQKHSMLIEGREKNPQIDEAYLLLGKARYYDQRFIPALEAFNYILHKYPASNTINHAQIWREKTNLRLENEKLAIKNLKRLIELGRMNDQDNADAHAILAQAYINTGSLDSAVVAIRTAANSTRVNEEKGRYSFIQGQLYSRLQKRDSASMAFENVIDLNRKIPREYLVNAMLEKSRNFNFSAEDPTALLIELQEMEEDRENRPYLDKIHFQIAEYYNHLDSTALAIEYYNKSLGSKVNDNFLRSVNYETLGNIYFDRADYRTAGAYYDSTLTKIPTTTRDYFVIKRKRDNLQEVILYEEIAERNDSILNFVAMTDEERLDYFTGYTNKLKEMAIEEVQSGNVPEVSQPEPLSRSPGAPPALGGSGNAGNTFYFYNPSRVANGLQEFLRNWGPRELADNWRTNPGNISGTRPEGLDEVSELIIANNPQFNPRTYIDQIPTNPEAIDSISAQRNDSYYRLGLIYKEKFNENRLASQRLESLLDFTSEERLVVPASYYLYQIYLEDGNNAEAEKYKQAVLKNYPESRYAANILNPGAAIATEDSPEVSYQKLYELFEKGEYVQVLETGKEYSEKFRDDELIPKIELLTAMATGRLYGFEAYQEALNNVAVNYPQTTEGKKAQELLSNTLPNLAKKEFEPGETSGNIKILFRFARNDKSEAETLKGTIEKAIEEMGYRNASTSLDVYDPENLFVLVHGIDNMARAEGFAELLQVNESYKIEEDPIFISSENYRVVQLHKNLEAYLELKD